MARHPFTRTAAGDPWRIAWLAALGLILATSWRGNAWLDGLRDLLDGTVLTLALGGGIAAMIAVPAVRLARNGAPGTRRALVAAGDEAFQHVLPERTGSALDVGANALSGLAGAALATAGARTRRTPSQQD